jgi:hypothetical protein
MSSSDAEPDTTNVETEVPAEPESPIGNLTVEDDPEGTVDPADLAGTASDDDADVS